MELLYTLLLAVFLAVASHYIGQALPRESFFADRFPYRSFAFEKNGSIYRRIGVHKWMDMVPDMSRVMGDMVPKKLRAGMTAEDVRVLIRETCVAEHVHFMLCVVFLFVSRFWVDSTWVFFWVIYAVSSSSSATTDRCCFACLPAWKRGRAALPPPSRRKPPQNRNERIPFSP